MPNSSLTRRIVVAAVCTVLSPVAAMAQQPLKIFDSHLHYNGAGTNAFFTVDQVLDVFRRNAVAGIVANSRPNRGTQQLVDAKAPGLWVVPFIRPYRVESDVSTWYTNPEIYELIETEYKRGYYKGVGEFHIYGEDTRAPLVKKTVDFAVAHDLFLLAHSDEAAIPILHSHNPKAKVIWAHTGFGASTALLREYLTKYPSMMAELSYRSGITEGGGKLSDDWRDLFAKHSNRFLLGSDTWVNGRWSSYGETMREYRGWLAQLPPEQARLVAHGNAERIYGGKIE
jgi:Amidohydrolase